MNIRNFILHCKRNNKHIPNMPCGFKFLSVKMNILFINNTLFSPEGISRVLTIVASELAKYHDVTILCYEKKEKENRALFGLTPSIKIEYWEDDYVRCYLRRAIHKLNQKTGILKKLGSPFLYDWTYIPAKIQNKWIDYINKNRFDTVCGIQANNAIILGKISNKIHCKTIGWQHSSYEAYLETKGLYYYNQDFLFEQYVRKLNYYVVLNEHDEKMFKKKKGINAVTIYNTKSFSSEVKSTCKNKRFIACGSFRYVKGFDLLIESFKLFHEYNREWVLDIYGKGAEEKKLRDLIEANKLTNCVFIKGVTNEVDKEMINSSALLLSSRWEGMPMVVLEALECGLPVVAYNINAMIPLVDDGVEGIIVPSFDTKKYAEAMLEIAQDEGKRKFLGANAAKKAALFTPEVIGKKWLKLINN